jgi:limonene-1,2-epoxide hydrolase
LEGEQWDPAQIERAVSRMASDARYHIFAWEDPFVGHDAIRAELLREASHHRDVRTDIVAIASVGHIVFTERVDSGILRDKPYTAHIAGVFEVDAADKIMAWRDYLDSRELSVQLGQAYEWPVTQVGEPTQEP